MLHKKVKQFVLPINCLQILTTKKLKLNSLKYYIDSSNFLNLCFQPDYNQLNHASVHNFLFSMYFVCARVVAVTHSLVVQKAYNSSPGGSNRSDRKTQPKSVFLPGLLAFRHAKIHKFYRNKVCAKMILPKKVRKLRQK